MATSKLSYEQLNGENFPQNFVPLRIRMEIFFDQHRQKASKWFELIFLSNDLVQQRCLTVSPFASCVELGL